MSQNTVALGKAQYRGLSQNNLLYFVFSIVRDHLRPLDNVSQDCICLFNIMTINLQQGKLVKKQLSVYNTMKYNKN